MCNLEKQKSTNGQRELTSLSLSLCVLRMMYGKTENYRQHMMTHWPFCVFTMKCVLLIDGLVLMDRPVVGNSRYCQVFSRVQGGVDWGRKKHRNKERMGEGGNIDQVACTLDSILT